MIDIASDFSLYNTYINTRKNILDLLYSTNLDMVQNVKVAPEKSDHDIGLANINTKL